MTDAVRIAREIVDGTISASAGAARIWVLSSENNGACFDELREFIAAASQRDELPQYREALATDSRRAAEKLIALQGNARGG